MNEYRFQQITGKYAQLKIAVVGDFCLDRYFEIDPGLEETSLETGLPVYNVTKIRAQPGGAGTIVSNLSALGIGEIYPVGFCGADGEGFELRNALVELPGVRGDYFFSSQQRQTFTYCKPLVLTPGKPPVELNRLDIKNWTPTPAALQGKIMGAVDELHTRVDAIILLDQVDKPETGVLFSQVLNSIGGIIKELPGLLILADSRRNLTNFPPCAFKVNRSEFSAMTGLSPGAGIEQIKEKALALAQRQSRRVFVTLSEEGILGAFPNGTFEHVSAFPVRGPIDVVGAGDSVTANLTAALAAGAELGDALDLANAAAAIVIHQLGTTGTASVSQLRDLLPRPGS